MFLGDGSECALSVIIGRNQFFFMSIWTVMMTVERAVSHIVLRSGFLGSSHMWLASCIVLVFKRNMFLDYGGEFNPTKPRKVLLD